MRLSDEDRRRIYEEEKARIEARERIEAEREEERERIEAEREAEEVRQKAEDKRRGWMVVLGIAAIILVAGPIVRSLSPHSLSSPPPAPSPAVAPAPPPPPPAAGPSSEELRARGQQANAHLHDYLKNHPVPGIVYAEMRWGGDDIPDYVLDMMVTTNVILEYLDASRDKREYFLSSLGTLGVNMLAGNAEHVWLTVRDPSLKIIAQGLYPHH